MEPTKSSSMASRKESSELAARRTSMMLMAASTGDRQQLWRGETETLAAAAHHQVAIDVASCDGDDAALVEAVTEETGFSALHVVAAAGDGDRYLESARVICGRARRLLDAPDRKGDTPLHRAARAGNARMVAQLVELAGGEDEVKALVRARNGRGETALHEAVRFGGTKMVRVLMDGDRGLAGVVADDGTSPLYLASSLGREKIARELHQKGDGLSYSGPDGQNALHAAVLHHRGELYPFSVRVIST
jgi:ankyrin repeat protein